MDKQYLLEEINRMEEFPIIFSKKVRQEINSIKDFNQDNKKALDMWYMNLNTYIDLLSHRSVVWDYATQQISFPNGTLCMYADGFKIGYSVKTNAYGAYVFIFMIDYQLDKYRLKIPPILKENRLFHPLIETSLYQLIQNSVRTVLREHLNRERKRQIV